MDPRYPHLNTSPPIPRSMTGATRHSRRRTNPAIAVVSAAVVVVLGVLVWTVLPLGKGATTTTDDPRLLASEQPTTSTSTSGTTRRNTTKPTEVADPRNLLTPAGVRAAIAKLKPVMGGTKVYRMVLYPQYASVEAPVKGEKGIYDNFTYRDGEAARQGPGSTTTETAIDLSKFNWDALPALFRKANKELGVRKPTIRYLVVDPSFAFLGARQAMLIYVGDEYRTGYLVANAQGKVIRTNPA